MDWLKVFKQAAIYMGMIYLFGLLAWAMDAVNIVRTSDVGGLVMEWSALAIVLAAIKQWRAERKKEREMIEAILEASRKYRLQEDGKIIEAEFSAERSPRHAEKGKI